MLDAGRVQPWSAEIPALYGVTVTLKDPAGKTIEIIPLHTGFREVKIEGGQLLVNGQPHYQRRQPPRNGTPTAGMSSRKSG